MTVQRIGFIVGLAGFILTLLVPAVLFGQGAVHLHACGHARPEVTLLAREPAVQPLPGNRLLFRESGPLRSANVAAQLVLFNSCLEADKALYGDRRLCELSP